MKLLGVLLLLLVPVSHVAAESQGGLILSGYVPVRAEVRFAQDANGKVEIISNSSEGLKLEVSKRSPASVVSVTAP